MSLSVVTSPSGLTTAVSEPEVPAALLMPMSLRVKEASLRSTAICIEPSAMGWATKRTAPPRNSEASKPSLARSATSMLEARRMEGWVSEVPEISISASMPSISAVPPN